MEWGPVYSYILPSTAHKGPQQVFISTPPPSDTLPRFQPRQLQNADLIIMLRQYHVWLWAYWGYVNLT